jgi:drug/metabolite transporter (DMT)-like permease|tara:strand:- start:2799 stop:3635 length:837 start_codon:yes stop_codon:yes gene_type:complete
VAAFLALLAACLFGLGDFCGGLASRRIEPLRVVAYTSVIGLILVVAVAPFMANSFTTQSLTLGALAGVLGMIGVGLLYRGLGRGPMTVVAPITAVNSAAIPVVWGLTFGETLSSLHVLGILLGLLAIVLVSRSPDITMDRPRGLIAEATLAGAGFAGFFIVIDAAQDATAPWPLVGARIASMLLALAVLFAQGAPVLPTKLDRVGGLVVATGVFDMGANMAFLFAVNIGLLSLVSVLAALYPATTVILARVVLQERMSRSQILGMAGAVGSVALIALG